MATIAQNITRLQTAKADLKTAIEAKGVTVPSATKIDGYATLVGQIQTGGGTASADLRDLIEKDITSIVIPDGTTKIGAYTFVSCEDLESVTIPNSVTRIENDAFNNCNSLESITIPSNVTFIGNSAFRYCTSLTSVNIPRGVTVVAASVFEGCTSLTNITIPSTVTSISQYAFKDCTSLASVIVLATTPPTLGTTPFSNNAVGRKIYVPAESVNAYKAASGWSTYAADIEAISDILATFNVSDTSNATPIMYSSYTTSKFSSIEIDNVALPSVVSSYTFSSTGMHTVKYTLVNSTAVGESTFRNCVDLASVTISDTVTTIGGSAFDGCSGLTSITIPDSVTSVGDYAFRGCTSLPVENNIRYADTCLVEATDKTLSSYTIRKGTKWISRDAFNGCSNLESINMPEDFSTSTTAYIPDGIISIANNAFRGCKSLEDVVIPTSVTTIGASAFYSCTGLSTVVIPASVTSIGNWVFSRCSGLTALYMVSTTPPTLGTDLLQSVSNCTIYVPESSVNTYKAAAGWSDYASIIEGYQKVTVVNGDTGNYTNGVIDPADYFGAILADGKSVSMNDLYAYDAMLGYNFDDSNDHTFNYLLLSTTTDMNVFCGCMFYSISFPDQMTTFTYQDMTMDIQEVTMGNAVSTIDISASSQSEVITGYTLTLNTAIPPTIVPYNDGNDDYYDFINVDAMITVPSGTLTDYQSATGWDIFTNITE